MSKPDPVRLVVIIIILDMLILYQFAVWFENGLKNSGWFDGLTIPIVGVGALVFAIANLFALKESLKKVELIKEEQK